MKIKAIILITGIFLFANILQAQNFAFKVGEKLEYNMYYNLGFIWLDAAKVKFTVEEDVYEEQPVYNLFMTSETVKSFAVFYFKDTTYSYVNQKTLLPYFTYQASREKKYFSIDKYTFPQDVTPWQVFLERKTTRNHTHSIFTAEKPHYDLLSTLYRLRNIDASALTVNEKIPMPMIFNDGTYDLYIRYVGKEQIKLKNGKIYNALKFKPMLAEGKMFEKGEGMTIWISDDENKIPLMVESKMKIGSVKAMLSSEKHIAHPMNSEVKKK